jgi:hypothetical protein
LADAILFLKEVTFMCFWKRKKNPKTEPQAERPSIFSHPLDNHAFSFNELPTTVSAFAALPELKAADPFSTAALTILALAAYRVDPKAAFAMLDLLKNPGALSNQDKSFIADRLNYGKDYKPFSYFEGAVPQNNYTATAPFIVKVSEKPNSYDDAGYATLYVQSSGADSPRPIRLRKRADGTWALWEEFLLADIIAPKKDNPWA